MRRHDCSEVFVGDEYFEVGKVVLLFDEPEDQRQGLMFSDGVPCGGFTVYPTWFLSEEERQKVAEREIKKIAEREMKKTRNR